MFVDTLSSYLKNEFIEYLRQNKEQEQSDDNLKMMLKKIKLAVNLLKPAINDDEM